MITPRQERMPPVDLSDDEILKRLLDLNLERVVKQDAKPNNLSMLWVMGPGSRFAWPG